MKKRISIVALLLAALLLLAGCQAAQRTPEPAVQAESPAAQAEPDAPDETPSAAEPAQTDAEKPTAAEPAPADMEPSAQQEAAPEPEPPAEKTPAEQEPEEASEEDAPTYDPSAAVTSDEFVLSNGVRMDMSYEEAMQTLGNPAGAPAEPGGDYVSFETDGVIYTFYPAQDGVYYLWSVHIENGTDVTIFRGICLGEYIDDVFAKIPARDTELKQWAWQVLYEDGENCSYLEFVALSYYAMRIQTADFSAHLTFSRLGTAVKWIDLYSNGI